MTARGERASALVVQAVSQPRLWQMLMDIARYGATAKGGVNRQALSAEEIEAKRHIVKWAAENGFRTFQDDAGNLFVRREGEESEVDPVMTGSHIDSQPTGGKFDGAYGVIAGLELLRALDDAGIRTRRPIEVVAWTNEEGSRFAPGTMGSSVFAGVRNLAALREATDRSGIRLHDALEEALAAVPATRRFLGAVRPHSYVEAHIEQGPLLEASGTQIGVVTSIQGIRRLTVDVLGEEAHAGTTPRRSRKDALSSAVAIISALERLTADEKDILRFTVGQFDVFPGSANTIPGLVHFTISLRHPDDGVLRTVGDQIHEVAKRESGKCEPVVTDVTHVMPTTFNSKIVDRIRQSAERLGYSHMDMPSGAGHDAMHLSAICPTGMIFIPCRLGISHNELESATPEQLVAGTQVLADTLVSLANE